MGTDVAGSVEAVLGKVSKPSADPLPRESRRIYHYLCDGPCNKELGTARILEALQWAYRLGNHAGEQETVRRMENWLRARPMQESPLVKVLLNVARGWHE